MIFRTLACIAFLLFGVAADEGFIDPPPFGEYEDFSSNLLYHIGDALTLRWTSSLTSITILLWQNGNEDPETVAGNIVNVGIYNWTVSTQNDYHSQRRSQGNIFYLSIHPSSGTQSAIQSHYFNLTDPVSLLTSSSPPALTSASASDSRNGVALGVGLGIGLGVPAMLLAAAALWFWYRRRQLGAARRVDAKSADDQVMSDNGAWPGLDSARQYYSSATGVGAGSYGQNVSVGGEPIEVVGDVAHPLSTYMNASAVEDPQRQSTYELHASQTLKSIFRSW